jgi:PII-like signaling protein
MQLLLCFCPNQPLPSNFCKAVRYARPSTGCELRVDGAAYNGKGGGAMSNTGPAKKVTVYLGQDQQYHGESVYAAILEFLFYRKVAGATVTRGIAGFGADHRMQTDRILALTENLPMKVEFIETPERVAELLPKLLEMAGAGLIEVQDTTVVKAVERSEQASSTPRKQAGTAKLMRIFVGENDKWNGKPLHKALMESMRANDIAGVTVYQGILGYGAKRRIHQDSALHLSHDRPMMLSVVDTEERLRAFLPVLDDMMHQGLVVFSDVDVIKYSHNDQGGERRQAVRP